VGVDPSGMNLRLPTVAMMPMYTEKQLSEFGMQQRTEYRMSVFNLVF
jgi:hypothetical protein